MYGLFTYIYHKNQPMDPMGLHAHSHCKAQGAATTVNAWCLDFRLAEMDDFPKSLFARCVSWALSIFRGHLNGIHFGGIKQCKMHPCMVIWGISHTSAWSFGWCPIMTLLGEIAGGFLDFFMKSVVASLTLECMILSFLESHTPSRETRRSKIYTPGIGILLFFREGLFDRVSVEDRCIYQHVSAGFSWISSFLCWCADLCFWSIWAWYLSSDANPRLSDVSEGEVSEAISEASAVSDKKPIYKENAASARVLEASSDQPQICGSIGICLMFFWIGDHMTLCFYMFYACLHLMNSRGDL